VLTKVNEGTDSHLLAVYGVISDPLNLNQKAGRVTQSPIEADASERPSRLHFAPNYNVVVAFIDRHIAEGRGAKVAIRTADSAITYAELADNVNRCADGLLRLGLARGERVLMVVKDCPAFFYLFWGAIKAGIVPVPLNTLLRRAVTLS
jgi:hypothetical protein